MSNGTDYRSFFSGRYLSAPDLLADTTLTIKRVNGEAIEDPDGGAPRRKMVVHWQEDTKPWIPCKTTAICMAAMWGDHVEGWEGRRITLYHDKTVRIGRKVVGGIRVRGAPDLKGPMSVEIKLPRRKPSTVKLVPTSNGQRQSNGNGNGYGNDDDRLALEAWFADHDLTIADGDRWAEDNGRSPMSSSPPGAVLQWLRNNPDVMSAIRGA